MAVYISLRKILANNFFSIFIKKYYKYILKIRYFKTVS